MPPPGGRNKNMACQTPSLRKNQSSCLKILSDNLSPIMNLLAGVEHEVHDSVQKDVEANI